MATLGELGRRVWMLAHRRRADRELDEELRLHQELLARRSGNAPPTAAGGVLKQTREFGSPLRIKEETRDVVGWRAVEDIGQDMAYGLRALAGNKAFAIAAIITLTFGLGATTAIFSLVNGVVFRPLPFADPDRLVQMYGTPAIRGEAVSGFAAIREQSRSFDALVAYNLSAGYLQAADGPERIMTRGRGP